MLKFTRKFFVKIRIQKLRKILKVMFEHILFSNRAFQSFLCNMDYWINIQSYSRWIVAQTFTENGTQDRSEYLVVTKRGAALSISNILVFAIITSSKKLVSTLICQMEFPVYVLFSDPSLFEYFFNINSYAYFHQFSRN